MTSIQTDLDLSVVIPIKNEEENILSLENEIQTALSESQLTFEIIWVNDGSTDSSRSVLEGLSRRSEHNRFVHLPISIGQSGALWYGFQICHGSLIATMDGDGQNDPKDLLFLIHQVLNGALDMANGYRQNREDNWTRKVSSKIANSFRNRLIGYSVRDIGCSIRVFRRECVRFVPPFKGLHRFLPSIIQDFGFTIDEFPVNHRPRVKGLTKYSIGNRFWVSLFDLIGVYWLKKRGFLKTLIERKIDIPKL